VIDLHCHILPGLDDGARTLDDSRDLGRRSAAEGIETIAATPHVRADYPTRPEQMERGVQALRDDFAVQGIHVGVLHGGEIDLELLPKLSGEDLRRFTIAQTGRYLLLEFPYVGWPLGLERAVFDLIAAGMRPILAHPERNRETQARPERLDSVLRIGAVVQLTAASVDGRLGRSSQSAARRLVGLGFVDLIASDAHTPAIRGAGLAAAAAALGDEALAHYLTVDAPAAIVAGEALPDRPARKRRRFTRFH
jgi:protein-tyrosine phosphatase